MPLSLVGMRSTNEIKCLSDLSPEKVNITVLPDQAYALQAVLFQLKDKPQPEIPEEILQKSRCLGLWEAKKSRWPTQ